MRCGPYTNISDVIVCFLLDNLFASLTCVKFLFESLI